MDPHFARNMSEDFVTVVETDFERRTGERFDDLSLKTNKFFIISHNLHGCPKSRRLCQHKKRGDCVFRAFLNLASRQYTLSREPYALFKCAHSVREREKIVKPGFGD